MLTQFDSRFPLFADPNNFNFQLLKFLGHGDRGN